MTNNFTPAKAGQQSKRLSKEEYAEKMKAEKEAVYQMADDTAKAIVSDPEKFKAFLDTQSRLDRYSAVNALLIFKQLPEASQLKNFDDWSKDNVKIQKCALPGFVDSKNEEKTERNAGYLVVSQSGGGMLRQGTREGIRRTPANRGMRAHRIVKGLDISEDVCHGMCP